MQVFIVGSIYDTVIALDKRRKHKQWVEIQQIIDAIDGKKAWKNHPCTIQYKEYKYWLILYRTVIEFINMDMHSSAKAISQKAENFKPEWHCEEYFNQMKKRLYTKDKEHYKCFESYGVSNCNWYWSQEENKFIKYLDGKRIE